MNGYRLVAVALWETSFPPATRWIVLFSKHWKMCFCICFPFVYIRGYSWLKKRFSYAL